MALLLDSWFNIVFVVIFSVIIYVVDLIKTRLRYFEDNSINHDSFKLKSVVKSIIAGENIEDFLSYLYRNYSEYLYVGYYNLLQPTFLIRDPDLINKVTEIDFDKFHDRCYYGTDEKMNSSSATLLNLDGDKWKEVRYKLNSAFSQEKLQIIFPLMQSCANSLTQKVRKSWISPDEDIDAMELFSSYTSTALASCLFGIEPDAIKDPGCEFRKMLQKQLYKNPTEMIQILMKSNFPILSYIFRYQPKESELYFINLIKNEIIKRKSPNMRRSDLIQLVMDMKEKGRAGDRNDNIVQNSATNLEWTDEFLALHLLMLFLYGYETSVHVIAITSYYLSKNPTVQVKLRKDIRLAKQRSSTLNIQSLKDTILLDNCIAESLRLFPPTGYIYRVCTEDFQLDDGKIIKKGQGISIGIRSIQTDEKYWKNSDKYDPDRFIKDDIKTGTYIPFGHGPRSCLGKNLAIYITKLILAKMIENFEILPSNRKQEPFKRNKWFDQTIQGGVWIKLQPIDLSSI